MYLITVEFVIRPEHADAFRRAVANQARNSVDREPGCRQFDVGVDPENSRRFFLFEVYDDREAFDAHRKTPHFAEFSGLVTDWIESKTLHGWDRLDPGVQGTTP